MSSRQPRIKICGLKDTATIEAMNGLPIHEIGFVFAPSKRQIDPATAALLISAVHEIRGAGGVRPRTAGVFVNASLQEINEVLAAAPLDIVQLHGDESVQLCKELRYEQPHIHIWKVFSIKDEQHASSCGPPQSYEQSPLEKLQPYQSAVDAILIDAPGGGTGQVFQWELIHSYNQAADALGLPLYVAGGLHADNVQQLLHIYSPDGIDVSSGVETAGKKDIEKMKLFVRRVLEA